RRYSPHGVPGPTRVSSASAEGRSRSKYPPNGTCWRSGGPCRSGQPIEAAGRGGEDLALLVVGEVGALRQLLHRLRIAVVPVREVRGVHDAIVAHVGERLGQERLVGLAREVDTALPHVFRGGLPEQLGL